MAEVTSQSIKQLIRNISQWVKLRVQVSYGHWF